MEISWITVVLALIVLIVVLALALAAYSGLFYRVKVAIGKPSIGNVTIAYKLARGPYQGCGFLFDEVLSLAPQLRAIGVYYDDPDEVAEEKLRYAVGSILAEGEDRVDEAVVKMFESRGFKTFSFPAADRVVYCDFPFTTKLSLYIAIRKVYGTFCPYIKERELHANPFIEVYHDAMIDYLAPLDHHRQFYVPEALVAGPISKMAGLDEQ